ncbi:single-stranded DNA-binding protein [Streptomyces sp. AJS327]|uniref:single-stranded DNA-binding protein n=1 Tax=Streptomyces sp. AJS327 TaxID=2545265 RepID=UPI0015DEAEFC|nr:single-stranded DNA-binding protein [Streptomyces sp. AJS327]MBA0049792.1 single-stranded DNA-binding protein [Streptomyces sp. AJS327]
MYESHMTAVGNVATAIEFKTSRSGVSAVRFRLASTVRRFDQREGWKDGHTNFLTVWAWRALADNLAASVSVGDPLVVRGQLRLREGEKEGKRFQSAELMASAAGHDLSRGTSAFVRRAQVKPALTTGSSGTPRTPVTARPGAESPWASAESPWDGAAAEASVPGQLPVP